jgi:hypothetical protein
VPVCGSPPLTLLAELSSRSTLLASREFLLPCPLNTGCLQSCSAGWNLIVHTSSCTYQHRLSFQTFVESLSESRSACATHEFRARSKIQARSRAKCPTLQLGCICSNLRSLDVTWVLDCKTQSWFFSRSKRYIVPQISEHIRSDIIRFTWTCQTDFVRNHPTACEGVANFKLGYLLKT